MPCQLHVFYDLSKGLGLYFHSDGFASMYSKLSHTDVLWFYWDLQAHIKMSSF